MHDDTKKDDSSASSASGSFGDWIDNPDDSKDWPFNTWSCLAEFIDCVFSDAGLNNGFCARLEELKCSGKSAEEIADELDLIATAAEGAAIDMGRLARAWRDRQVSSISLDGIHGSYSVRDGMIFMQALGAGEADTARRDAGRCPR